MKTNSDSNHQPRVMTPVRPTGFTLIEVLIAMLVLSIGLLGMAGIQIQGMRGTQSAYLKTDATNIARDMAERMLANPVATHHRGALTDRNGVVFADNQFANIDSTAYVCNPGVIQCRSTGTSCTPTMMADYDIESWICGIFKSDGTQGFSIAERLENGAATVQCTDNTPGDGDTCSAGSPHRIIVSWNETDPDTGNFINRSSTVVVVPR